MLGLVGDGSWVRVATRDWHTVNMLTFVDGLYTKPTGLRSAPGGTAAMADLAAEFDQKFLGNGHCNRPSELDCQFESICESCAYFSTNESFTPVLEAQRCHAADRDQHHRVDLSTCSSNAPEPTSNHHHHPHL